MGEVLTTPRLLEIEVTSCAKCGVEFGLTKAYIAERRKDGQGFHCPNGHSVIFGQSEAAKLREQLRRAEAQLTHAADQRDAARREITGLKRTAAQERRRTAAGVCPCCKRSFVQLRRHMAAKHPEQLEAK
jgi:DNA repair exonuclease SbcCD ATPase subunit